MSPFLNSTFLNPCSLGADVALFSISSVKSIPMTFPASLTCFEDMNASIPAPEPKSTTVSPSFRLAKLSGAPHPTPSRRFGYLSQVHSHYSLLIVVLVQVKIRNYNNHLAYSSIQSCRLLQFCHIFL